jgi:preprotein translocase subunit SecF
LGKRYWFFALSLLIIIPGIILLVIDGFPLSIDFKGGTLLELKFPETQGPQLEEIKSIYDDLGIVDSQITTSSDNVVIIRSSVLSDETRGQVLAALEAKYSTGIEVQKFDTVSPLVSQQVTRYAILAVCIAAIAIIIYITFAFRGMTHAFRYGICAIIAMAHDVLIVLSLTAIGGRFFNWQVDTLYLTAVLTVIGFSVQDKIVVFDRIRENSSIYRKLDFETLANHSIVQTLQRSINTQLMTVEFMLLSIALFGGVTLREFCVILLVGLFSGTYSSIFIAAPTLVVWESREWKRWFSKKTA